MVKNPINTEEQDSRASVRTFHMNPGYASAANPKRALADAENETTAALKVAGKVADPREVCRASEKAPRVPIAEAHAASPFNRKAQLDFLSPGDVLKSHAIDLLSKNSRLARVPSKFGAPSRNPLQVRGAFSTSWVSFRLALSHPDRFWRDMGE